MLARSRFRAAVVLPLALMALALAACPNNKPRRERSGCKRDTDCKGDRVCIAGNCEEPQRPANTATPPTPPPTPPLAPTPPPNPGVQNPNVMAADGLPVVIPPPGSPPPSVAEWNSVVREVSVAGSSALNCETKMLREWLKVTCRKNGRDVPINVRRDHSEGQQDYVFKSDGLTSVVVQVVRGRTSHHIFTWDTRGRSWGRELRVTWPAQLPRPTIQLANVR